MDDQTRLPRDVRKKVLDAALLSVADDVGLLMVTHDLVADACVPSCSARTVRDYYPTKLALWRRAASLNPIYRKDLP